MSGHSKLWLCSRGLRHIHCHTTSGRWHTCCTWTAIGTPPYCMAHNTVPAFYHRPDKHDQHGFHHHTMTSPVSSVGSLRYTRDTLGKWKRNKCSGSELWPIQRCFIQHAVETEAHIVAAKLCLPICQPPQRTMTEWVQKEFRKNSGSCSKKWNHNTIKYCSSAKTSAAWTKVDLIIIHWIKSFIKCKVKHFLPQFPILSFIGQHKILGQQEEEKTI